ncbi:protein TSSC4-like [Xyrauchen texanus]|uniref:protein TSSC4-like n=1 Tax=Xyrauchen texanus TaxID=154827 RepID=UPI002241D505|nr:protein TSSC4-like [Xyrauchen texanus]XP_052007324.1 protein TSSC4-like [Xyrauchen texanus]XP_052007333.1 protein TSSC4-like [Xyrauchen texanus]XP_052007341.1 protein TSSC4-like [Xyrauchen texanus]XP_052007350.1 protein TSSC4-like [Xyrauchen texanus]XP_052007357.1 protein TSSC4-like [Xyrauchen texanus]
MTDPKCKEKDAPNSLSNRDAIELPDDLSLSDSDSDEPTEHFSRKVEDLSSSEEEEDARPRLPVPQYNPTFRLTGGSSGFCDRSKDIFTQLDSAAKLTSKQLGEDNILDGMFARPAPPSPPDVAQGKCDVDPEATKTQPLGKKLPNYLAHPERWTHYSLEDIPETIDQVAPQDIQGLQESKRSQNAVLETFTPAFNQDHASSYDNKIVFTKPKSKDQSRNKLDHLSKEEVGLKHLDDGQDNEEGESTPLHHLGSWKNEEKKRKWFPEKEKEEEDKKVTSVVFNSGRKLNRKRFRKTIEDEEGAE